MLNKFIALEIPQIKLLRTAKMSVSALVLAPGLNIAWE